jgi:hypothetical protein
VAPGTVARAQRLLGSQGIARSISGRQREKR